MESVTKNLEKWVGCYVEVIDPRSPLTRNLVGRVLRINDFGHLEVCFVKEEDITVLNFEPLQLKLLPKPTSLPDSPIAKGDWVRVISKTDRFYDKIGQVKYPHWDTFCVKFHPSEPSEFVSQLSVKKVEPPGTSIPEETKESERSLKIGDRVRVTCKTHPQYGEVGEIGAFNKYSPYKPFVRFEGPHGRISYYLNRASLERVDKENALGGDMPETKTNAELEPSVPESPEHKTNSSFPIGSTVIYSGPEEELQGRKGVVIKQEGEERSLVDLAKRSEDGPNRFFLWNEHLTLCDKEPEEFPVGTVVTYTGKNFGCTGKVGKVVKNQNEIFSLVRFDGLTYPYDKYLCDKKNLAVGDRSGTKQGDMKTDQSNHKPNTHTKGKEMETESPLKVGDWVRTKSGVTGTLEFVTQDFVGVQCGKPGDPASNFSFLRGDVSKTTPPANRIATYPETSQVSNRLPIMPEKILTLGGIPKLDSLLEEENKLFSQLGKLRTRFVYLREEMTKDVAAFTDGTKTYEELRTEIQRLDDLRNTQAKIEDALMGDIARRARHIADCVMRGGRGHWVSFEKLKDLCGANQVGEVIDAALKLESSLTVVEHKGEKLLKVKRFF